MSHPRCGDGIPSLPQDIAEDLHLPLHVTRADLVMSDGESPRVEVCWLWCSSGTGRGCARRTHSAERLAPLLEASYRSGRSPGYRRRTRWSSSSESPRPTSRRDCSSAPAMKAARSRRLSSRRRLALPVGWSGCWFTPAFSPFVPLATTALVRSSAEPDRDPPFAKVGDEVPRTRLLEAPSEVGHVGRQGRHIGGPLGTPVARAELGRHHRRQRCGIPQRGADGVVARIGRWSVLHRTDVLIADNTRRALLA
jgi:hypothetical protein